MDHVPQVLQRHGGRKVSRSSRDELLGFINNDEVVLPCSAGGVVSVNLNVSNPNRAADLAHRSPEELTESILDKERQIAEIVENIRTMVKKRP